MVLHNSNQSKPPYRAPPLHHLSIPRYKSLHDMSPQSEFFSEEKMGQLHPEAFRVRTETSLFLRNYTIKMMEECRKDWDPENPRSFLEMFMAKRLVLLLLLVIVIVVLVLVIRFLLLLLLLSGFIMCATQNKILGLENTKTCWKSR